jgi:hypothetical protein
MFVILVQDKWEWSDGWLVEYTNWFDTTAENGTCAAIFPQ